MSKDKGNRTLQRYFISGIAILFFGLLYLFLLGSLSFNKDSWLPSFTTTSPPLVSLQADNVGMSQENQQTVEPSLQNEDSDKGSNPSSQLNSPLQDNSDLPQQQAVVDIVGKTNKEDTQVKVDSPLTQKQKEEAIVALQKSQKTSDQILYKLPNGADVKISTTGFSYIFQQAIENKIVGKPIIFDRVSFPSGSETLDKQSNIQIAEAAALLNTYKDIHISIRGHSDNKGSSQKNSILSLMRSGSMKKALIDLGIDRKRIQIEGVGDQEPIASNKTKRGRRNNRRIDLIIKK
ncbi:MAG: OmpA family protein [Cocleimonas sp.]|nr:OmpA family protein [Cocleimonas sp.]